MKLLLVADLHYTLRQWDWLGSVADQFDLVVIAGDLLDLGSIVPLEAQIVVIRKYLERLGQRSKLLVTSGNHDILATADAERKTAAWLQQSRRPCLHVDGDRHERDGFFFSLMPWWEDPEDIKKLERQLDAHAKLARGKRWVWVYHAPAKQSPLAWNGRMDWGDDQLPRWVDRYRPEFVLGGHVHQAPFVRDGSWIDHQQGAWRFNSGRQPGGVPTFTVIDTDAGRAVWVSAEQAEEAKLRTPLVRTDFDGHL